MFLILVGGNGYQIQTDTWPSPSPLHVSSLYRLKRKKTGGLKLSILAVNDQDLQLTLCPRL